MSGPLADQVTRHAPRGLNTRERAILMKLAIRADHDGSGADLPVRWLTHDLAISPRKAREGLAELEKRGLIVTDDPGGPGRGRVARRRVIPQPCGDLARCQPCRALAELLASPEKGPQGTTRRTT